MATETLTPQRRALNKAARLIFEASEYERQAKTALMTGNNTEALRLRGRALQKRGAAWVIQADNQEKM